ncbi:MAG: flagellar basal body P-ring formation protein FlgA [Deltaproteobacteria bacterium]|nr:MAG: flagellar basal body P-ring formation protein FlgA [Deltaproteobacteria bacterium]
MTEGIRSRPGQGPGATLARRSPCGMSPRRDSLGHDRDLKIAIFVATLAFLAVLANRVHADPLDAIVRARLAPSLPAGLEVARVYLPAGLASLDTAPEAVAIELPRELRAGRPSVKLTVRGHRSAWVPVAIAAAVDVAIAQRALAAGDVIAAGDVAIEHRAIADVAPAPAAALIGATVTTAIAAGAPIGARDVALPPPLARGTQVAIDLRRGAVHIRGTGTLELSARPGEPASARLAATKIVVHGTLVAPATLVVGDLP